MIWKKKPKLQAAPVLSKSAAQALLEHEASCSALCCASRGDSVCVLALLGETCEAARLREMGLCEGARVQVLRKGNPIVVRVADSRLGLAHAVAERVMVVPDSMPAGTPDDAPALVVG